MEEISHQFAKKLKDLSPTSISIQSLSKWCVRRLRPACLPARPLRSPFRRSRFHTAHAQDSVGTLGFHVTLR